MTSFRCVRAPLRTVACLVVALACGSAPAVTIDWVTVGNPGNAADTTGYGGVSDAYKIGKYEVTIGQYAEFLNAVDPNGTNTYGLYNLGSGTDGNISGILFSSGSASGQKYSPIGSANRPVTYVSWWDAARFANWMNNGQGSGSTETGAYTLGGATSGTAPARNPGAQVYIPTEDQWYKAAYYKGGGTSAGYWTYATQSDTAPGNSIGSGANQANWRPGNVFAVTQSASYSTSQNYLTDVGAFTNSASAYGTFDQNGNVWELNDLTGAADSSRGLRGNYWADTNVLALQSSFRLSVSSTDEGPSIGFRLAAVPEPSTWAMALAGLAAGGLMIRRRRS